MNKALNPLLNKNQKNKLRLTPSGKKNLEITAV